MSGRLQILTQALTVIEEGLDRELSPQEVADRCHYSLSTLQKIFHHTFHLGIADYISRRRITRAARDLLTTGDTVLDIALCYGYASHEVFTRAFRRLWGETPSHFRRHRSFSDLYPRPIITQGGTTMTTTRGFDTGLYDVIQTRLGTYALIFDTVHLTEVNDRFGRAVGDLVIAECLKRIDEAREDDMPLLRVGGDEYVLLTGCTEAARAQALSDEVLRRNGEPIACAAGDVPVGLRCVSVLLTREMMQPDVSWVKACMARHVREQEG